MSAGNHAQGVAYHAKRLGIPAVIVMPKYTPNVKVEHTRGHGAEVILHGETFDDASAFTQKLAKKRRLTLVHPYDDELVMAGQGTIALEMLAQQPRIETLLVPIGGGGLIAGMAVAARGMKPDLASGGGAIRAFSRHGPVAAPGAGAVRALYRRRRHRGQESRQTDARAGPETGRATSCSWARANWRMRC